MTYHYMLHKVETAINDIVSMDWGLKRRLHARIGQAMDQENSQQYANYRSHLVESRYQSHNQFDKAIFLLAGGGLTVSLTIIKDLICFEQATTKFLLYWSWALFIVPLITTLLSFLISIKAIDKQIDATDRYYLEDDEDAINQKNVYADITKYFNYVSATSFVLAVVCMMLFTYCNVKDTGKRNEPQKRIEQQANEYVNSAGHTRIQPVSDSTQKA